MGPARGRECGHRDGGGGFKPKGIGLLGPGFGGFFLLLGLCVVVVYLL